MNGADESRLELFRQLKKEIRGSERHLIVGIDENLRSVPFENLAEERHSGGTAVDGRSAP
jgi:hypothetical protein